jgi:hypothetical protein
MKKVFFDLETKRLLQNVPEPQRADEIKNLGVSVAGAAVNGGKVKVYEENEIPTLISTLEKSDFIIGHNLKRFDYIVLRPYTDDDRVTSLQIKTIDIFEKLSSLRNGFGKGLGLSSLALLNLGIKKDFSGTEMPKLWQAGEKEKVIKHLEDDVKITRALYEHIKKQKKIKYEHWDYGENKGVRELKIPDGLFN